MILRNFVFCLFLLVAGVGHGGPVTLDSEELARLRILVKVEPEVSLLFLQMKKTADAALEEQPNPIESIVSEGHLESDLKKIRTRAALDDMKKIYALAYTWAIIGDERYADAARSFIFIWARLNKSDGNPINETKFEPLIDAYDLLRPTFSKSERDVIDAWLQDKAWKLWMDPRVRRENWQSHRLKVIGLIGAVIENDDLWRLVVEGFKDHIVDNFESSGVSIDFKRRDSMHYHLYSVKPLVILACVAERRGESLFSYRASSGASLEQAIEFVRPYVIGEKRHIEFVNTEVGFDRRRVAAGEKIYAPHLWKVSGAYDTYSEAGCIDSKYDKFAAEKFKNTKNLNWRNALNVAIHQKTIQKSLHK